MLAVMSSQRFSCQTCKDRRIKCDGARPDCQRCIRSRRQCIHRDSCDQADFQIHLENRYADGKIKRPRGPRSSLNRMGSQSNLPALALSYYLRNHLHPAMTPSNTLGGLSECVLAWKATKRKIPMVDLALSSMALVVYSRIHRHRMAGAEASARYHLLLRTLQEHIVRMEISSLDKENIDVLLLVMYIMSRYESATTCPSDISVRNSFQLLGSWSHHSGATAVLKIWYDMPGRDTATVIIKHTRRGLIRSCLLRKLQIPDWMLDGEGFGESHRELQHDRIIVELVNLRHVLNTLQLGGNLSSMTVQALLQQSDQLDEALRAWMTELAELYPYQQHRLTAPGLLPREHLYSSTVLIHPTIGAAAIWGNVFAQTMLIADTKLKLLAIAGVDSSIRMQLGRQQPGCRACIDEMADNLAGTLPFCLGKLTHIILNPVSEQSSITFERTADIKPYAASLMVWPLTIASNLETLREKQRLWFKCELAEVGRILGDGLLESADATRWMSL